MDPRWITLGLILIYFTLLTASRARATLGKLVQGLRVVDYEGNTLKPWRAALRSSILGGLAVGALTIVSCATDPTLYPIAIGSILVVLLPAFTPRRHGVQDIVAGSIVAQKDGLQRPDAHECIRHVVRKGAARPPVLSIFGNVLLIFLPALSLFWTGVVHEEMNVRARVSYALQETGDLRSLVDDYYTLEGSFPPNAVSLGVAVETPYPAGGYYRLEKDGAISIGFTVLPALKNGSIVLEPSADNNDAIHWDCTVHGDLAEKYVPADCRE
ncbi:MAG: pilin [Chromatiaceae bacterium]